MGAKNSRPAPVCADTVECEPQVAYVKRECEKVGANVLHKVMQNSLISLVGISNGTEILNAYNSARGNRIFRWDSIYPELTIMGFKNYEGFKEGASNKCVECSCSAAAEKIIAECRKVDPAVPDAIDTIITSGESLIAPSVQQAYNMAPAPTAPIDKWVSTYNPGLFDNKENFTNTNININKETFANNNNNNNNIKLYKFIKDAIQERHTKFKNTDTFVKDCNNSSYYSMKKFITEEKEMLDKLYSYYTSFVKSYESQYLQRESVTKIINNKLDELEKIQSKIDSYKTNLHVDNRKNNYQNNNYEFYINVKKYMLILYYSLFVLYLIFSKFISDKQYTNKKILLILAIYLLIPIVLSYTINITYEGYIYFLEFYNIKEDTKSYADIIKA
jgi:hypothetical protein